jgi:hypothetical protein
MATYSSCASTPSFCPPSWGLLSHLIFDWTIFPVFSSSTTLPSFLPLLLLVLLLSATSRTDFLLSLSYHATTSQLWKLFSRLTHLLRSFLVSSPICKRTLSPLSGHESTPSKGVYAAILVGDIVSIPSSIKKTLIQWGISLRSPPLMYFLKYASTHEKYWWFLATNSIMYPSKVVLTQKLIAHVTGRSIK